MLRRAQQAPTLALVLFTSLLTWQACSKVKAPAQAPDSPPGENDDLSLTESYSTKLTDGGALPKGLTGKHSLESGKTWQYIYEKREAELAAYIEANREGYEAFTSRAVAANGTPALFIRLLPEIMPEIFSDEKFEIATGYYKKNPKDILPYGLAFTKAPASADGKPSPMLVNLTCGACHTGRIAKSGKDFKQLIGAPSTVADVNGFRRILGEAAMNPNFTFEKFRAALVTKADGELYGPDKIMEERIDKAIFLGTANTPSFGAAMVQQFKTGIAERTAYTSKTAGSYTFKGDLRLLGSSPGHIDFPVAVALSVAPQAEVLANPAAALVKYFPAAPGIADIMSAWRQDERVYAQWDGNLKGKLTRNLGAELGIAGDPRAVNFSNAVTTTEFVEKLPAPAYPFPVNLGKAAKGQRIYDRACASCHENEEFVPVAAIGTEPGRAKGLTKETGLLLVEALKIACSDKNYAGCNIADNEIFVRRDENPGYISVPMTGIWARAPYLHNGSVPTIAQLLVPETRPEIFQLNDLNYDQARIGFQSEIKAIQASAGKRVVRYDTKIPGYGNAGHADLKIFNGGIDFKKHPKKLEELLEYLKTK